MEFKEEVVLDADEVLMDEGGGEECPMDGEIGVERPDFAPVDGSMLMVRFIIEFYACDASVM